MNAELTTYDVSKMKTRDIQLSIFAILSKPRFEFTLEDARLNRKLIAELTRRKAYKSKD